MVYILNIHTATENAIINLTAGEKILGTLYNYETKQHASFLHIAIKELLDRHEISIKDLDAIGISLGPGSYTGIRVGLATAKGLCYALKIPLITYTSLELIALSASNSIKDNHAFYCPMIDARRMEVYTAIYDCHLREIMHPSALVINENSFVEILKQHRMYFSGNGSIKFRELINNANAIFLNEELSSNSLAKIAWEKFLEKKFENVNYAQPLYLK